MAATCLTYEYNEDSESATLTVGCDDTDHINIVMEGKFLFIDECPPLPHRVDKQEIVRFLRNLGRALKMKVISDILWIRSNMLRLLK